VPSDSNIQTRPVTGTVDASELQRLQRERSQKEQLYRRELDAMSREVGSQGRVSSNTAGERTIVTSSPQSAKAAAIPTKAEAKQDYMLHQSR
jgi:hypothetical protein